MKTRRIVVLIAGLTLAGLSYGQERQWPETCTCAETIWQDTEVSVRRLTIPPHTKTKPAVHRGDYIFIPLTDLEVIRSIHGHTRSPLAGIDEATAKVAWTVQGTQVRFIHPKETEPEAGQVLFNESDSTYVAVEIDILDQKMPDLQPRVSLFTDHSNNLRSWKLGKYSLSVQLVGAGAPLQLPTSTEGMLFSTSAINLETGSTRNYKSLVPGELLTFRSNIDKPRNLTSLSTTIVMLERPLEQRLAEKGTLGETKAGSR